MRKDVRLGLAIGGSAIVIVACSVLFFRNPEPKPVVQGGQNPSPSPENVATGTSSQGDTAHNGGALGAGTGTATGGIGQGTVSFGPSDLHGTGTGTGTGTPGGDAAIGNGTGTGTALIPGTGAAPGTGATAGASDAMAAGTGTGGSWQSLLDGGGNVTRTSTPGHEAGASGMDNPGGGSTPFGSGFGGTSPGTVVAPPPAAGAKTYIVQPNDTYWTISQKEYGNGAYYSHVMRANPGVPANRLKAGVSIRIPDKSEVVPSGAVPVASGTPATLDAKTQYRVQQGDNLYTICKKLYGKTDKVAKLYQLNKDLIGPNPSALKVNTVLQLPDAPTSLETGTTVGTIQ